MGLFMFTNGNNNLICSNGRRLKRSMFLASYYWQHCK